jgi:uncharacterized protein YbjT (DUF2867 family)
MSTETILATGVAGSVGATSSPVAASDVGAAAVVILANPTPHIGEIYELTSFASLTLTEIAHEFPVALGRPIRSVNVPPHM